MATFRSGVPGPGGATPPPPLGRRLWIVGWSGVSNCVRSGAGGGRRVSCFPDLPQSSAVFRSPASLWSLNRTSVLSPQVTPCSCSVSFCLSFSFCHCSLGSFSPCASWVHTCHFSLCPISSLCTYSASLSLALGLYYAGNLRRANCPELSVVPAASGRGARGLGDSQAWHLEFLRERHLALPWPCGPWGKYVRDYCFLPSPYRPVTSQWSRDGFNFSWSYV